MIGAPSWLDPWPDFDAIFAEVWRERRIAPAWPACLAFPPGHSPASRDDRYVRPVIRSWIGGRTTDPHHSHTLLAHSPEGHTTMRFTRTHILPAALTLALAAGLTVGTFGPFGGSEPRPPAGSVTVTDPTEAAAWEIFEHGGGAAALKVDPSRPYRVEFMSATPEYPSWAGPLDAVVVGKDGRWYWFAASYTDLTRS